MIYPGKRSVHTEKNVHSLVFDWNVLHVSVESLWSNILVIANVSLLIFCLNDLSIDRSPTTIVLLSISFFRSVSICFMYLGVPMLCA